jgi:hypothetical protein
MTLRSILISLFIYNCLLFSFDAIGQKQSFFEGTLTYKHHCKSNVLSQDSLNSIYGQGSVYSYKGAYYKGILFSRDTIVYVYHGDLAKCILTQTSESGVYCLDYSKAGEYRSTNLKRLKKTTNVNGYPCHILEYELGDHTIRSYYHTKVRLDPAVYKKHAAYGYAAQMEMVKGGILVMSEHIYPSYTLVFELVNIFPTKLSDKEFALDFFKDCK